MLCTDNVNFQKINKVFYLIKAKGGHQETLGQQLGGIDVDFLGIPNGFKALVICGTALYLVHQRSPK